MLGSLFYDYHGRWRSAFRAVLPSAAVTPFIGLLGILIFHVFGIDAHWTDVSNWPTRIHALIPGAILGTALGGVVGVQIGVILALYRIWNKAQGAWSIGCGAFQAADDLSDERLAFQIEGSPFRSSTQVSFVAPGNPANSRVRLTVHDLTGRRVCTLLDGPVPGGPNSVGWNGTGHGGRALPGGVYFFRLSTGGEPVTRRALLIR